MHSTRHSGEDAYRVLELEGHTDALEEALARLEEAGCLGAEECEPSRWKLFFDGATDEVRVLEDLRSAYPHLAARWVESVKDEDWSAALRSSFHGGPVGEKFFVLPTWQDPPETSRAILRIDPEQAFGTGTHESTRLCAAAIERVEVAGREVIDVGTGSGILAMMCAILGASCVLGIEPDVAAAACARRNIDRNGLGSIVRIEPRGFEQYSRLQADLIVANLYSALLVQALPRCHAERIIVSGLLVSELASFEESLPAHFDIIDSSAEAEWATLTLGRRA